MKLRVQILFLLAMFGTQVFAQTNNYWTGFRRGVADASLTASSQSGAFTAGSAQLYFLDATNGSFTASLPSASGNDGASYYFIKKDATVNTITIDPSGSETIDNAATFVLSAPRHALHVLAQNGSWYVVAEENKPSASVYISNGSVTPNAPGAGTFVKVTGFTPGLVRGIVFAGDSLKVLTAGRYQASVALSLSGAVITDGFKVLLAVNNVNQTNFQAEMGVAVASDGGTVAFSGEYDLTAGSGLSLKVANTASAFDPTITQATIIVKKL